MWIFGYGSLIWNSGGIPFQEQRIGKISGYVRRFWQGSNDHRGTVNKPGRVVTLIHLDEYRFNSSVLFQDNLVALDSGTVWGIAYLVADDDAAQVREYLDYREKNGYEILYVDVYCQDGTIVKDAMVYIAEPTNEEFLGAASDMEIAKHIMTSKGPSGFNYLYLYELYHAIKLKFPVEGRDLHVEAIVNACNVFIDSLEDSNQRTLLKQELLKYLV